MYSKIKAEEVIDKIFDEGRLRKIIRNTSVVAWNNAISEANVDQWLNNFTGLYFSNPKIERKLALWLLAHFAYYTYKDIRVLCKNLFNLILHQCMLETNESSSLENVLHELEMETLFVGLGNDSESGNNLLYYFRQENKLPKKCFEYDSKKIYKNVVYIDDVTMSGSQATEYVKMCNIKAENIYAAFLLATDTAISNIENSGLKFKILSTMVLDSRDKAFSSDAYAFSDIKVSDLRMVAKKFCALYGAIAIEGNGYMDQYPLGFADGQYMLGFEYNIPDNTLPIFWGTSNEWYPLFKRYEKIYSGEKGSAIDGRKYY